MCVPNFKKKTWTQNNILQRATLQVKCYAQFTQDLEHNRKSRRGAITKREQVFVRRSYAFYTTIEF